MEFVKDDNRINGTIIRLVGVVVDVEFESGNLPSIYNALVVKRRSGEDLILEIQEHVGTKVVRAIAMGSTAGLRRGMTVIDLGKPIEVPIGRQDPGPTFQRLWTSIDGKGPLDVEQVSNSQKTPTISEQVVSRENCYRHQSDRLAGRLIPKVEKLVYLAGAGVGKTVLMLELDEQHYHQEFWHCCFLRRGERSREGNDMWLEMKRFRLLDR